MEHKSKKKYCNEYLYVFFVSHSLSMNMGWRCPTRPPHFSTHSFLSVNILSNVTAAYLVFCMTHSSWWSLSYGCMFSYSRTMLGDNLSTALALHYSFLSLVFVTWNFVLHLGHARGKLCVTFGASKRSTLVLTECFCCQLCLSSL